MFISLTNNIIIKQEINFEAGSDGVDNKMNKKNQYND